MAETPQAVPPAQPAWLSLVDGEMCINHAHPVIAALMDVLTIDGDYEYGLDVLGRWQAALGVTADQTKTDRAAARIEEIRQGLKHVGEGGMTSGDCNECNWKWPCPTYAWATTDRDPNGPWDPADDEPAEPQGGAQDEADGECLDATFYHDDEDDDA